MGINRQPTSWHLVRLLTECFIDPHGPSGPWLSVLLIPRVPQVPDWVFYGPQGPSEVHVFYPPQSLGFVGQMGSQPPVPRCLLARPYHVLDHQTHKTQPILEQILIICPKWKKSLMSTVHIQPIMIVLQSPCGTLQKYFHKPKDNIFTNHRPIHLSVIAIVL